MRRDYHSFADHSRAIFNGNAPPTGPSVFDKAATNFPVDYYASRSGFASPTWLGYSTAALDTPESLISWLATKYRPRCGWAPDRLGGAPRQRRDS